MKETEIYVEIIEGSAEPMFASVPAAHLGKRFYRILEHNRPDCNTLRFNTGTYVICLLSKLEISLELVPVAYSEISKEAVDYILSFPSQK